MTIRGSGAAIIRRLPPSVRALAARALSILASFALTIVVARNLPVEATGSFFVVYTLGAVAASFGRFGIDNLAIKLLGTPGSHRSDLRHGWQLAGVASVIGGAAFGLALGLLGVHELGGLGVLWAALTVPPQALAVIAGSILRGRGRLVWGILAELGSIPAVASLAILGAGLVTTLSLDDVVAIFAISAFLSAAWAVPLAVAAARANDVADPSGSPPARSGLGGFVAQRWRALSSMMGVSLVYYSVAWAPILTLTVVGRVADVAWVTIASRLANFVTLVPAIQVSYLGPQFSDRYHTGQIPELNQLARRSSRQALMAVALPAALLVMGAPWLVGTLYGPEFEAAAPLVSVLAIAALIVVGLGQVNQLMLICDLEGWALLLSLTVVAVWATLGLWLAQTEGAWGVVFLAAVGTIVYSIAAAALLHRKRDVRSFV